MSNFENFSFNRDHTANFERFGGMAAVAEMAFRSAFDGESREEIRLALANELSAE